MLGGINRFYLRVGVQIRVFVRCGHEDLVRISPVADFLPKINHLQQLHGQQQNIMGDVTSWGAKRGIIRRILEAHD